MKRVLALLLVLVMVLGLAACGKDKKIENPNLIVIGDHQALYTGAWITKDYDGDDAIVIPLTYTNNSKETASFLWSMFYTGLQGGIEMEIATIFVSADSYETLSEGTMTDVAAGGSLDLNLTYKLKNLTDPVVIEFSDLMDKETGKLEIDVTKLEVKPAPDAEEAPAEPETTDAPEASVSGGPVTYKLNSFTAAGRELGPDMVEMMGGGYMIFNGDGTGTFALFGEVIPVTYDEDSIIMDGMDMPYSVSGTTMTFTMGDTEYAMEETDEVPDLSGSGEEESGGKGSKEGYAFDADFLESYMGDWHGMAEFYDCTGDYSDEDGMQCEIVARLVFDEDGHCAPYVRLCLSNPENENFVINAMNYDEEYDCMTIDGTLKEKPIDEAGSFVELEGDVLYIGAGYDDGSGDVFNLLGCLRRLDDTWDYENDYPALPEAGVEFYKGMTMEEIVELYGYDTSLIPALSGAPTGGKDSGKKEEEKPAEETKPEGPELPFETGIPSGDGIVELQQLKDFKNWVYGINTYENNYYKPTYEECLEQMGVDPAPSRPEKWEDDYVTYVWSTADGKDKLTLTLQPTEDGSGWVYKAISFTNGVNS